MRNLLPSPIRGRTLTLFAVAPLLVTILGFPLWSQDIETERWAVPMRVDRQQITTGMLMETNFERIESLYTEFESEGDPDKERMDSFIESVLSGDIDQAVQLTLDTPATPRENARELLNAFSDLLEPLSDSIQLDRVVHMGEDRLLLWSLPNGEQNYYRSFRFVRDDSGELAYEGVLTEPISSLITNAHQVGQLEGPSERDVTELEFEYTLPGTEASPVKMRFNGTQFDVDAFQSQDPTQNEVVDFYRAATQALATGTPQQHAAFYAPYSSGRYVDWALEQGDVRYEAYRSDMIEYGSRVVFLLDAAPMYLVFFLPSNPAVQGDPLRYVSIYDDPDNGLRLANFYIEGLTETFIKNRQYFEEPFLRPYLANAGIISPQNEPENIIASSGEAEPPDAQELSAIVDEYTPEPEPGPEPEFTDIEDIASDGAPWPWIIGAAIILAIAALALSQRQRNKK